MDAMAADDKPTWRVATGEDLKVMMSAEGVNIMAERHPRTGHVVFVFSEEVLEEFRAAGMEPDDFIADAVARGALEQIPYLN
jgi:hypothetical protein